jgi:hypothetical protein
MSKECENLRDAAIAAVITSDGSRSEVLKLLTAYQNDSRANDIVYALIFEMEILHKVQEKVHFQNQQLNEMMLARLEKLMNRHCERMQEIVNRQQMISRSQFRRLVSFHRERLLTRLIIICALGMLSIFAGLGVFYFYILVVF